MKSVSVITRPSVLHRGKHATVALLLDSKWQSPHFARAWWVRWKTTVALRMPTLPPRTSSHTGIVNCNTTKGSDLPAETVKALVQLHCDCRVKIVSRFIRALLLAWWFEERQLLQVSLSTMQDNLHLHGYDCTFNHCHFALSDWTDGRIGEQRYKNRGGSKRWWKRTEFEKRNYGVSITVTNG